jgi:hypothetical protein
VDDFASLIITAVRANLVGKAHFTTVAAGNQVGWYEGVMRPAAIAPALRVLTLWLRNHFPLLLCVPGMARTAIIIPIFKKRADYTGVRL